MVETEEINKLQVVYNSPETFFNQVYENLDISQKTVRDYKYRTPQFINFLQDNGFSRQSLLQYKRYLEERDDYSVSTKNKYLATAKVFLKVVYTNGIVPQDISQTAKCFPQIKKHKRAGFTSEEIEIIANKLKELPLSKKTARLKAILSLLIFQGLRQIEVIRLDVDDIDFAGNTVLIQGKGNHDKELIYLHPQVIKALKAHIRMNKVKTNALFKGLGRKTSERISLMTINRDIRWLLEPLGIDKSAHGFRHYYITKLLENFDVRDVRKFSRHKSLEMLIVYDDEIDIRSKVQETFKCFKTVKVL